MRPEHLRYAESLKADLLTANQPFSAEVVAQLLQERAELLAACEAFINADRSEHLAARLNDAEMAAVEAMKAAITKARGTKALNMCWDKCPTLFKSCQFAQRITYTPGKGFELGEVIKQ